MPLGSRAVSLRARWCVGVPGVACRSRSWSWSGVRKLGDPRMVDDTSSIGPAAGESRERTGHARLLALLLAMAMFVLVVDTSLMNVSISAVVRDLDTTASGVQS